MTTSGALLEYILDLRPQTTDGAGGRASDQETAIEVSAHHVAEWPLLVPNTVAAPTATCSANSSNPNHGSAKTLNPSVKRIVAGRQLGGDCGSTTGKHSGFWMSQVEIVTYAPPHRR